MRRREVMTSTLIRVLEYLSGTSEGVTPTRVANDLGLQFRAAYTALAFLWMYGLMDAQRSGQITILTLTPAFREQIKNSQGRRRKDP